MSRLEDVSEAILKIRAIEEITDENYKEIHLAMLGHIAACLAVIADSGMKWIKLHRATTGEATMVNVANIVEYSAYGNDTRVYFAGTDNYTDVRETPVEVRELINEAAK